MAGLLRRGSPGKKYYVVYIVHVTQLCLCAECGPDRGSESIFVHRSVRTSLSSHRWGLRYTAPQFPARVSSTSRHITQCSSPVAARETRGPMDCRRR